MSLADIRVALRTFILAGSPNPIAALVGARVYMNKLEQAERMPALVMHRVDEMTVPTMQGPSGLERARFQIDAYALNSTQADTLTRLVKERILGYRGNMGSVPVQGVFLQTVRDGFDDETKLHRVSCDYFIWYEER